MNRAERRRLERKQSKRGDGGETTAADAVAAASRSELLFIIPLMLLGLVAYGNSFRGAFVLDDFRKIMESTRIRRVMDFWSDRPLVDLTLGINYSLHEFDVAGYHVVNLGIHLAAGIALFLLVRATLTLDRFRTTFERSRGWIAFAIAAIWLVHPLQTQSVTYVIQRGESLMGLFYLLTMLGVARCALAPTPASRRGWGIATVVACGLGMLSKAVMVTAPIVAFMYDWLVVTRSIKTTIQRRWPMYAGLSATWLVLGSTGILWSMFGGSEPMPGATAGFKLEAMTGMEYLLTQPGVLTHYLRLAMWPHPLCLDYDWPLATTTSAIVVPGLVIVALLGLTAWFVWKRSWLGFLGVWFFFILAPTSSIVPIQDIAFEHRMYLPLAAIVVLVVIGVDWLRRYLLARGAQSRSTALRGVAGTLLGITLVLGVFGTFRRNRDYHTEQRMWSTVLAINPDNARAHTQFAKTLEEQDRNDEAITHYETSLRLNPSSPIALTNYGKVLVKVGRLDEGIALYRAALELNPNYVLAHNNLGNALVTARRFEEGATHLKQANALRPGDPMVLSNLGRAYGEQGNLREAARYLEQAVRLQPDYAAARTNLAAALLDLGRTDEAMENLVVALKFEPGDPNALNNLSVALMRSDDIDATAARYASRADIRVAHGLAYVLRGRDLRAAGDRAGAARAFQRALEIVPGLTAAQQALDGLSASGGAP